MPAAISAIRSTRPCSTCAAGLRASASDCVEQPLTGADRTLLEDLLERAGFELDPGSFRRYGSARRLYNFHIDHAGSY